MNKKICNTNLKIGSLFDGIGVFPLSASRFGINPIWASEIEKAPMSITKRHFPNMIHFGDINKVNGGEIPPVHIITDYFALTEQSIRIWSPPVDKSKNNKSKIEYAL